MNRNSTRSGRNGGRSMTSSRRNPQQSSEEEPIMFEYLQNIDRELEELKKKRQFIEQHHGYFQNQREPSYSRPENEREFLYNGPHFYEQSYDSPNASHSTYANSQGFEAQNNDYISFNSGRKRPNPWQSDAMLKRFAGYEGDNVEKSFGSRLGPKPTSRYFDEPMKFNQSYKQYKKRAPPKKNAVHSQKPAALMSVKTRGSFSSTRTEFKPKDKVSKPKFASTRSNNLNAYPLATRKTLIEETIKASPRRPPINKPSQTVKKVGEPLIFDGDSQQSRKVRGRLELAVGHILKDIKERMHMKVQDDLYSAPANMQRLLKQIIRERLRTLMLGKRIDLFMDIVNAYRKRYPLDTDENMIKTAQETLESCTEFTEADTAEKYLKLNLSRVLMKKLNEMFVKLKEVYSNSEDTSKSTVVIKTEEDNDVIIVEATTAIGNNSAMPDTCKKLTFTLEELDNLLEQKLPLLLPKFVPQLTEIMSMDYSYESSVGEVIIKTVSRKARGKKFEQLDKTQDNNDTENHKEQMNVIKKEEETDWKKSNEPLLFVKIIGCPSLPTRDVMHNFLQEFNPKTIKKHKRRHNLLFVGFAEKKNFDDIIAKNGTTLGNFTIEIKPKDATGNKPEGNTTNDNIDSNENVATNEISHQHDTSLDSELNCQIDDLLSSIRQGEDNNGSEKITEPTTAEILNTGDFDFEAKEQNKVTLIFDSDEDKNDDKPIIETENGNVEIQREKVDENIGHKLSEFTVGTLEIIEDITEEAEENTEISKKDAEETRNLEDKSEVNITREDPVVVENTAEINTEHNNDMVQAEAPVNEQTITEDIETSAPLNGEELKSEITAKAIIEEKKDESLKKTVQATPTRASSRLASVKPSTIITRRSSKLAQNNE